VLPSKATAILISLKQLVEHICFIPNGSPFQVEETTLKNARLCLVEVVARGTRSWFKNYCCWLL